MGQMAQEGLYLYLGLLTLFSGAGITVVLTVNDCNARMFLL